MADQPTHRLPFDVAADDLIGTYQRAHNLISGFILGAVERGATGTEAYWRQQQAAVDAALAMLKREAAPAGDELTRTVYQATADAVDAVTGAHTAVGRFGFTGVHREAVAALVQAQRSQLDGAVRTVGREARDIFRHVQLEHAKLREATADDRRAATARLVTDLRQRGITAFVDRSGRRWTLESYGKMTVRTNSREAATLATITRQQQAGMDLLQISDHQTDTPLCEPYEGNTYSISGDHPTYPEPPETPYRGNRWPPYHPNCWHLATPASASLDEYEASLQNALHHPDAEDPDDLLPGPGDDGGPAPARVDRLVADLNPDALTEFMQARPAGDPASGDPFVKDDRMYVALEPLREYITGATGQEYTRAELKAAVEQLGFTRKPYSYRNAEGKQTSASYYSAPASDVLRRGGTPPPPPPKPVVPPPPPPRVEVPKPPEPPKPSPDAIPLQSDKLDEVRRLVAMMGAPGSGARLRKDPDHMERIGQRIREELDLRTGGMRAAIVKRNLDLLRDEAQLREEWHRLRAEGLRISPIIRERPTELNDRMNEIEDRMAAITEERWQLQDGKTDLTINELTFELNRLVEEKFKGKQARLKAAREQHTSDPATMRAVYDLEAAEARIEALTEMRRLFITGVPRDEREVLLEILAELRPGYGTGKIKMQDPLGDLPAAARAAAEAASGRALGLDPAAKAELQRAARYFPKEWVTNSNRAGGVEPVLNPAGRGFYRHMLSQQQFDPTTGRTKPSSADGLVNMGSGGDTTVHEYAHRVQYTTKSNGRSWKENGRGRITSRIDAALGVLHKRRTRGERAESLGYADKTEVAKRDKYVNPYQGKEYDGDPRELFTMGIEGVFGTRNQIKTGDTEMWNVVVGMLASL